MPKKKKSKNTEKNTGMEFSLEFKDFCEIFTAWEEDNRNNPQDYMTVKDHNKMSSKEVGVLMARKFIRTVKERKANAKT